MHHCRLIPVPALLFLCVLALAPPAPAGDPAGTTPAAVLQEGDAVGGVGTVTRIDNLAVNDAGQWVVEADTDNPDTDADSVMVRDGSLLLAEGQALAEPSGATLDSFDTVNLNAGGASCWNLFLDNTAGINDDSGVYLDDVLLVQEGATSAAPGFTPGTPYIGFFECKLNDGNQVLVMASVDDPAIASTVDRALVRWNLGPGGVQSETALVKEGDVLPGQVQPVDDLETGPHSFAFNDAGAVLYIADLAGDTSTDHALYRDGTLLAQEGSPSPVAGRSWSSLSLGKVDLNESGSWVLGATLDGDAASNSIIVADGVKLVQEGDGHPAPAGFAFTSFGTGPVQIGDNGNVLWYGDWDDPDTDVDTGLFLNDRLLVQEGVTAVGGVLVDNLRGIQDGYALSDDGQWVLFEAELADGNEGAFLVEIGPWVSLGAGLAGTGGLVPSLVCSGDMTAGATTTVSLTGALPGSSAFFVLGFSELSLPFKGGTLVPQPDILIPGLPLDGAGGLQFGFPMPDPLPAGIDLFFQYWIIDPGGPVGFSASNAMVGTTE